MKKIFLTLSIAALFGVAITGCESGEDRMTEEELQAQVDSIYDVRAQELTQEMTLECEQRREMELPAKVDEIVAQAEMAQEDGSGTVDMEDGQTDPVEDNIAADTDTDEERTDQEIIDQRVQEKLDELRTSLRQDCDNQIAQLAGVQADSIIAARGMDVTVINSGGNTGGSTSGKTGGNTGGNTGGTTDAGKTDDTPPANDGATKRGAQDGENRATKRGGDDGENRATKRGGGN